MQMSVDPPAPPRRAESPAPVRQGLKSQTSNRQRPDRWIKPDTRVSRLNCQVNFDEFSTDGVQQIFLYIFAFDQ